MTDLLYARAQMALSLGFHIVFAAVGVALPLLMVIAEWRHLQTGDEVYLTLAKKWAKGTAILFAVGAVSGTVLSFELGLLWPTFMRHAGAIIGMPFSLEGFAFFTEAIFLGIYLYGWERVRPRAHLWAGVAVAVSGALSAFFVILANNWMNAPTGFRWLPGTAGGLGRAVEIDPLAAMFSPGWSHQVLHAVLASYVATTTAMVAIHAIGLWRDPESRFHRAAFNISLSVFVVSALLQPVSGHGTAQSMAVRQPVKLAAAEAHFHTERHAPARVLGIPDQKKRTVSLSLEIPGGLSYLAFGRFDAEVRGLADFPEKDWPPVLVVHLAFEAMVAIGSALALLAVLGSLAALRAWRRRRGSSSPPEWPPRWLLGAAILAGPLGFVALEAGWVVTEVGRQPWIIQGVMRTSEAVTPTTGLGPRFAIFTLIYIFLGAVTAALLYRQIAAAARAGAAKEAH